MILVVAFFCSLLGCVAAVALAMRRAPAPAMPFQVTSRRTRIAGVACLAAALTVVVGSLAWTPRSQAQAVTLGAGTTMVVVDLSGSIAEKQFATIRKTLTALGAQRNRHVGLVFFSDNAAEVLPPQTPASELAAVTRFFVGAARKPSGPRGFLADDSLPTNPWINAFTGGTAIYRGLNTARRALERVDARGGQIVLVSDLEDGQSPRTRTALLRIAAAKLQLRVVGLEPSEQSKQMYSDVFGPRVFVSTPKLAASAGGDRPERARGTRTLVPAALLTVVLLALFGRWQTPLRLRGAH